MAVVTVTEANLEDIGDAIRARAGTGDTFLPSQMAQAIRSIPNVEVDPTLTISGAAADARVTGLRFEGVDSDITRLGGRVQDVEDAMRHYTFTDSGGGQIVITEGGMG